MTGDRHDTPVRRLGLAAFAGVCVFVVVCGAAQFLRRDLDWIRAPLSFYLLGPGGRAVKCAYFALSISLVAIGVGFYRNMAREARSAAPLLLFVMAATGLTITALSDTAIVRGEISLHAYIHVLAAGTTFVCVATAMLMQSWRLRQDQHWQSKSGFALALAVAASIALCIYSLAHFLPQGLMQKIVIVLILYWLGWAAFALWQAADP